MRTPAHELLVLLCTLEVSRNWYQPPIFASLNPVHCEVTAPELRRAGSRGEHLLHSDAGQHKLLLPQHGAPWGSWPRETSVLSVHALDRSILTCGCAQTRGELHEISWRGNPRGLATSCKEQIYQFYGFCSPDKSTQHEERSKLSCFMWKSGV